MVVKHVVKEQMPRACVAHKLTAPDRQQNAHFFLLPCAQPRNNRPLRLFHRCGQKPLVRASPYILVYFQLLQCGPNWLESILFPAACTVQISLRRSISDQGKCTVQDYQQYTH